jgi:hypothetical protein
MCVRERRERGKEKSKKIFFFFFFFHQKNRFFVFRNRDCRPMCYATTKKCAKTANACARAKESAEKNKVDTATHSYAIRFSGEKKEKQNSASTNKYVWSLSCLSLSSVLVGRGARGAVLLAPLRPAANRKKK